MENKSILGILKNEKGVTVLYLLSAFFIMLFVSFALIKLAHHDIISSANFAMMTSAEDAAKSAVEAAEAYFENNSDTAVKYLNILMNNPSTPLWIVGDSVNPYTLDSQRKFATKMLHFDTSKMVVDIVGYGWGKGSSFRKVYSVMSLEGLGWINNPVNNWNNVNALYIGDGINLQTHDAFKIYGNCYFPAGVYFDSYVNGSEFYGIFRTEESVGVTTRFDACDIRFFDKAYFGSRVRVTGNVDLIFDSTVAFDKSASWGGSGNSYDLKGKSYYNANPAGLYASVGEIDYNHNPVTAYNSFSTVNIYYANFSSGSLSISSTKMELKDTLGIPEQVCEIETDASVIPASKIYLWGDVDDELGYSQFPGPSSSGIDGKLANMICNKAISDGKDWHGFAVVKLNKDMFTFDNGEKLSGKLIVLVNGRKIAPSAAGKCFSTTTAGNFTIVATGSSQVNNIGGWVYMRGFFNCDASSTIILGGSTNYIKNFHGAIHAESGANVEWYPLHGTASIYWDENVLKELDYDDFLVKTNCGLDSSASSHDSLVLTASRISPAQLGLHF